MNFKEFCKQTVGYSIVMMIYGVWTWFLMNYGDDIADSVMERISETKEERTVRKLEKQQAKANEKLTKLLKARQEDEIN